MKLIKLTSDDGQVLGIVRDYGRIERVDAQTDPAILDRLVNCFNACDGLSDASVKLMANGGTQAGNLVERTVAWSMFFSHNTRMARAFLEKGRAEIEKLKLKGDPV
uniref:Uncharacterized protein n=1 Tax=viral metagenome TaxID=1070528 RepID=A0A6M3KH79_9ZZZZ